LGARLEQAAERLEQLSNHSTQLEGSVRSLSAGQTEIRTSVAALKEQMNHNDKDLEHQLEIWRTTLDEQKDTIDRFAQQWTILSNQYKEARMAVQNFAHWQKQLEQQRRESSEMMRVESNRMQSQWDGLLLEVNERLENFEIELEQKWKNVEAEAEQKWSSARRSEQQWREELSHIDDLLVKLQEDNRNLIWRIQAAQADAIKKWPRLWLEEVEKAVELRPNRRLPASSTGSPSRAEMSVSDALEQGLIRIDYKDELDESLEQ
jgi:chromosome segregation ATPase